MKRKMLQYTFNVNYLFDMMNCTAGTHCIAHMATPDPVAIVQDDFKVPKAFATFVALGEESHLMVDHNTIL